MVHARLYDGLLEKLNFNTHYSPAAHYKQVRQNRSGIVAISDDWISGCDTMYGGGMYDGNFNVDPINNVNLIDRAYFVAALHPNPRSMLEIGLATGSWSRVITAYAPVQRHQIVEIDPDYLPLIGLYTPQKDLLKDNKVVIHIDDGRRWLNRNDGEKFDFILQNTTWHWRSNITNLLSVEYLQLCKRHLNPGGVMYYNTTWCDDVAVTAAQVFKHVVRYRTFVAASDAPFALSRAQIEDNLRKFRMAELLPDKSEGYRQQAMNSILSLAQHPLLDVGEQLRARADRWVITDDNMATEYKLAKWCRPERSWGAFFGAR